MKIMEPTEKIGKTNQNPTEHAIMLLNQTEHFFLLKTNPKILYPSYGCVPSHGFPLSKSLDLETPGDLGIPGTLPSPAATGCHQGTDAERWSSWSFAPVKLREFHRWSKAWSYRDGPVSDSNEEYINISPLN
jgi:hypothetical protein